MATASKMECSKRVDVKGGACLAASRQCACKVVYVDAMGRGWCKRHEPDTERKALIDQIAKVETAKEVK
jgi:hypothetical protein